MSAQAVGYLTGIGTLVVLYVIYGVLGHSWRLAKLYEGADGRPSTSKFQFLLWTVVVIFSFTGLFAARCRLDSCDVLSDLNQWPAHLLIAMGLSAGTVVAAKGITSAYVASGRIQKTEAPPPGTTLPTPASTPGTTPPTPSITRRGGGLFTNDDGDPDLSKVQLLSWTLIAVGIYLIQVGARLHQGTHSAMLLPDIDGSLMVLMGLGQGAYLGKKLTTTDTARITGISLASGKPGTQITLSGLSFGATQNGSLVTMDGATLTQTATWSDTQVTFSIPAQQANGAAWTPGQRINIGLIVGGQPSANTVPFTIT